MGWWARLHRRIGTTRVYGAVMKHIAPGLDRFAYRLSGGRFTLGGTVAPTLLLETTGRRSGQQRSTPLQFLTDGDAFVVVGTNWGGESHPAWTHNLLARPEATVHLGGDRIPVRARRLDHEEMRDYWPRFDAQFPSYAEYRKRTDRDIRMFRLEPTT